MIVSLRALKAGLAVEAVAFCLAGTVIADFGLHRRAQEDLGMNAYGYRGAVRIRKVLGERRVAVVGGSAAYGLGVAQAYTFPWYLAVRLNQGWRRDFQREGTTVVNLAEPGAGAASFVNTLRDYTYLDPDVICIYDGYAAVDGQPPSGGRRQSAAFRLTGYLPTLPPLRNGRPSWLTTPPDAVAPELLDDGKAADVSCAGGGAAYCRAMADAVEWSLAHAHAVIVATPPYLSRRHEEQQRSLSEALTARFGRDPRFRYVDVGRVVQLRAGLTLPGSPYLFDGRGNTEVAEALTDVTLELLRQP